MARPSEDIEYGMMPRMIPLLSLEEFLAPADAKRVRSVLQKLSACGLDYAVTGGLALEPSLGLNLGRQRAFNDIDVVVSGYETLPPALGTAFMVSHAHPRRSKGKLAIQLVETIERVRIDVFSACGGTLERARSAQIGDLPIKVISVEDMACRIASEMMSFCRGDTVPPKCVDDHLRAVQAVEPHLVEETWQEQRREIDPTSYSGALTLITKALELNSGTFKKADYSTDIDSVCPHCENAIPFKIAKPEAIFEILGYC
uniref:Nucleotidyl transferase AbiEii/AbiGii toxin family protein n=2 Tax=Rhizobium rhizogenes TaxID=359 RepID=A0A7S4ZTM8_RHIRH|nr:hypothetical protein pC5.7c_476 [Rhizobium rhizogenes]